jgi:hypothetical protein
LASFFSFPLDSRGERQKAGLLRGPSANQALSIACLGECKKSVAKRYLGAQNLSVIWTIDLICSDVMVLLSIKEPDADEG